MVKKVLLTQTQQLGSLIRFHRRAAGLTQAELGELAGVGKTVIFNLEKSITNIRLDTLLRVMRVLNISTHLESPLMADFDRSEDASR